MASLLLRFYLFTSMLMSHFNLSGLVRLSALYSRLFGVDFTIYSGHVRHVLVEKARHSSRRFVFIPMVNLPS